MALIVCVLAWWLFIGHILLWGVITKTVWTSAMIDIYSNGNYRKTSNKIRRTWLGNKIVDHSDVVGASPVGAAPTTASFSTWHLASRDSAKTATRQYDIFLKVEIWCLILETLRYIPCIYENVIINPSLACIAGLANVRHKSVSAILTSYNKSSHTSY